MGKINCLLCLFVVVASYSSCTSEDKTATVLLKFNLEKGKTYTYNMVWDMEQELQDQKSKINITGLYTVEVVDEKENIKTLNTTYRRFRMAMDMMGMKMDIDTDKPVENTGNESFEENPMAVMNEVFASIVGKTFSMKVDATGVVTEVTGFREMLQGIVDSAGGNEDTREKMLRSLSDQFNEQEIKDQFSQVFNVFPNKEVKVGDTWQNTLVAGGRMVAKFTTTYTVKAINGKKVTVGTKGTIESAGSGAEMETNGTHSGELLLDSDSGLMTEGKFVQDIQVTTQGMIIKMNNKGTITGKEK